MDKGKDTDQYQDQDQDKDKDKDRPAKAITTHDNHDQLKITNLFGTN